MSEKICGIYKITNLVNGKVYIGQSVDIYRRWEQHKKIGRGINGYKYKRNAKDPLYRAIQKYGVENFSFEIIEQCPEEMLSEKEIHWIAFYDSVVTHGKGYNQTLGGERSNGYTQRRKIYQYDLEGHFIAEYESVKEATISIGANRDNGLVQNAVGRIGAQAGGYQWRYEKLEKISPYIKEYKHHKVACYDKFGNLYTTFEDIKEAAQFFKVDKSAIGYNCSHSTKYTKGFMFEYYDEEPLKTIPVRVLKKIGGKGKPVAQIKNGEIVGLFESAREAAKIFTNGEINPNGENTICKICRKIPHVKTYKGFTWEFI